MKQAAIATAVLSALASASSYAATVYESDTTTLKIGGRIEFRGDFGDAVEGTMDNKSRIRLNIGGETQLNDNLTGFGFYEAQQDVENTGVSNPSESNFNQRYLYAGLKGSFGAVSAGKQDTALVQIAELSDLGNHTDTLIGYTNAGGKRINNTFVYGFSTDELSVHASFVAGNEKSTDGVAASALYTLPVGLTLGPWLCQWKKWRWQWQRISTHCRCAIRYRGV